MESLARVLVALIAIALVVNLISNGWEGTVRWMRAKFLGKEEGR